MLSHNVLLIGIIFYVYIGTCFKTKCSFYLSMAIERSQDLLLESRNNYDYLHYEINIFYMNIGKNNVVVISLLTYYTQ